jgi:hypothetical protein
MFTINWHFLSGTEVESAEIEEIADGALLDEAYPELKGGVQSFIERYLDAKETILVLQGPPGTGKTRLIRAILGEISRRKEEGEEAQVLYTGDMKALQGDSIFVKFITGWDDAFVVEDADHMLKPRSDGNDHLHRFLTIADGVVRTEPRGRPGRGADPPGPLLCAGERPLPHRRGGSPPRRAGDPEKLRRAERLLASNARSHSVASVYKAIC